MTNLVHLSSEKEGIFEVLLDDSIGKNYLSHQFCNELFDLLDGIERESSLKVLLLRGRKEVFCGGAPKEVLEGIFEGELDVKDIELPSRVMRFPVPIIAALEGSAVGGGLALAICCDITVASESRRYGLNFASLGFTPGMGTTAILPLRVGVDFAAEMLLTAKYYKGRELKGRGLFSHVLPGDEVYPAALDICLRIADKEQHVIRLIKDVLTMPLKLRLEEGIAREKLMHEICFSRPGARSKIEQNYMD